ncbi:MAG: hypothetical protein COY66_02690 [Candidatus Kerfeldbacteria bacterium CG_4_10_14_0_8_um_filter_42_10]|uniref:DUF5673 domain-containing protein n=1 Tax=Candidatus Kerfeldbacteria bacterium CG_4_10_14_0_8_um_filter_42_10 TaxID=2014248 RepID=A0A2M7RJQ3_9BACT|nr:MAG: hypothetical protein COY66_02690 [Candidatus Kerfeldbacteria bacterium CG_4_10_14_0_8_um_filter_42_10]
MAIDIKKPTKKQAESTNNSADTGKALMEWKFSEYEEYERGTVWYIMAAAIALGFLFYAVFTNNFLFALIIIIASLIILFQVNRKPDKINFKITEQGVVIGSSFHSYRDINKFWIIYNPPNSKTLYLSYKATLRPDITIPLENKNPLKVRDLLLENLEEDLTKEDESTSEQIRKFLKL